MRDVTTPDEKSRVGTLHLFVDNSNVLIEGRRFAESKRKGRAKLGKY